jgi:hypothetical protein
MHAWTLLRAKKVHCVAPRDAGRVRHCPTLRSRAPCASKFERSFGADLFGFYDEASPYTHDLERRRPESVSRVRADNGRKGMTMGLAACPRPRHLFPMFGTRVGCFVLEEALQHAGRKADRRGVIQSIQSFGAHGMAMRVRGKTGSASPRISGYCSGWGTPLPLLARPQKKLLEQ